MEQHPVPQNVTTFQFRLIGDMTLKQFGYLCAGAILAFIAYKLPLPFFITWPLSFALAFLGVGFAFIPIEERPMDIWVFSFFKSIYNPTQYIWTKSDETAGSSVKQSPKPPVQPVVQKQTPPVSKSAQSALSDIFQKNPHQQTISTQRILTQQPVPKPAFFSVPWLMSLFAPAAAKPPAPIIAVQAPKHPAPAQPSVVFVPVQNVTGTKPQQPEQQAPAAVPQRADTSQTEKMKTLETTIKTLQSRLNEKDVASERVLELQKQLTDLLTQKMSMEEELVSLRKKLESTNTPAKTAPIAPSFAKSTVTVINTQEAATKAGLPKLTTVPNVITGIVKDTEGNLLPSILVTVTNNESVPVRALKTNKLGQFGASTPLSPGTYFVEIEDPRNRFTFSRVQITLSGAVLPALEIIAKSQKEVTREKLAQEIFGSKGL